MNGKLVHDQLVSSRTLGVIVKHCTYKSSWMNVATASTASLGNFWVAGSARSRLVRPEAGSCSALTAVLNCNAFLFFASFFFPFLFLLFFLL